MNSKFMQMKAFPEKETSRDILQKPVLRAQDSRSFFYFLTILHFYERKEFFLSRMFMNCKLRQGFQIYLSEHDNY